MPISARDPQARRELVAAFSDLLAGPEDASAAADIAGVAYTAAVRRSHHPYRWSAVGRNPEELRERHGPAAELPEGFGGYRAVGAELFTDYVLAFEVTSLLLLGAVIGAVILAKRKIDG